MYLLLDQRDENRSKDECFNGSGLLMSKAKNTHFLLFYFLNWLTSLFKIRVAKD